MNPYQPPRAAVDQTDQTGPSVSIVLVRWLAFAIVPWGVLLLAVMVWWVSWYFLAPVLFPFTAYTFSSGEWTAFSFERMGWLINGGYSFVVGAVAAWLGRSLDHSKAVASYVGVLITAALAVHGVMTGLGYQYWYDTP